MKRLAFLLAVMAFAIVVPAQAKPAHPTHPAHPAHPSAGKSCAALNEGYNASGTVISAALMPATKKDHYNGTITVDLAYANHKAATGNQTFMLSNARVRFGKGVSSTAPAAGSRIHLHGKTTALRHGCSSTGFTPTITIRNIEIKQAK